MRTKDQRTQVTTRKTNIAFRRNQTGPSHAGPGPSQPPRKRSAPRNEVPIMCAYSAELDEGELHPAVLDAEAGHQLRLRLQDVERHPVLGGERGHQEGHEGELADDRVGHEPEPLLGRTIADICIEPASTTGTSAAKTNGRS